MAEIPSEIASSAAQSGFQAREVAKERGSAGAAQSHAADRQVRAVDEAGNTVDTDDPDARIFPDGEGQGGQGRETEVEAKAQEPGGEGAETSGITQDNDGNVHLDLEA